MHPDALGEERRSAPPHILCLVETPGQFTELERLTRLLSSRLSAQQTYLLYDCGTVTDAILARIEQLGAECANAVPSSAASVLRQASRVPLGLGRIVRYLRDLIHLPVFAARFRRLLKERNIDLVVIAEDGVSSRARALVVAATRLEIPALVLPFTIANPDEAAAALAQIRGHRLRRPDQFLFAMFWPRWVRTYRGNRLLRLPVVKALILQLTGLGPADPWVPNQGPAMVAVESRAMQRHYTSLGVPPASIALTGSLVDTILKESIDRRDELRAVLMQRLGLANKPLLLVALPPDQFRLGPPPDCRYSSYAELIHDLLAPLVRVRDHFAVVARPHPRLSERDLEPVTQAGIAVAWDDTALLIPLCDLYVASSSATIRWAIACARPVINFDVYRYGYDDYEGIAGVLRVDDVAAFDKALFDLSDARRRKSLADVQALAAPDWGYLDGGSDERILELCKRLLSRGSVQRLS